MNLLRGKIGLGLLAILFAHEGAAGRLSLLEKEVAEKSKAKTEEKKAAESRTQNDISNSSFGTGTYPSSGGGESFLGGFWAWLVAAPFQYQYDDPSGSLSQMDQEEGWEGSSRSIFPVHALGQPTAPYVRVDYNQQEIDSLTDAQDLRIEVGYKLIAFHGRMTTYDDSESTFDFNQYYGVLRYGGYRPGFIPGTFEFALGIGIAQITASSKESSGALTVPIKYHPTDWFGVEFRPAWYRWMDIDVSDYDLSASIGSRFVQLRGGYRWLGFEDVDANLDGPYAGVSLSF